MADRTEYVDPGDVAAQTIRTLQNVEGVLAAGGARFDDVMMLRVYSPSAKTSRS
jgi:enamine deaminase RidA (YjgF/YER057c/UK114 family)